MHEITVARTTDTGHRVVGHKGKCKSLHGHTYEFEVTLRCNELVEPGFVMDFGIVKQMIDEWDHKMLIWTEDPILWNADGIKDPQPWGIHMVAFNPTAENMAEYLANMFYNSEEHITFVSVVVRETESTAAEFTVGA
jgi:6-pyruvoyltetrahydropterin/6-carboxytetrahydropterin synthase